MRILIGGAGVVFKGEGWATTDKRGNGTDIFL
jgi:predicted nucleic acid-binding Zn ribbon protein